MTKEVEDVIPDLPENVEDIEGNPILKPLLEYNKSTKILAREESSESEYLIEKMKPLNTLLALEGIYDDSRIARAYKDVLEVYKRLLFISTRYTEIADEKIKDIQKIVERYYVTKKAHEEIIFELRKPQEKKEPEKKPKGEKKHLVEEDTMEDSSILI